MTAPPPDRDWALLSRECRNCGRDVDDPKAHWLDMCFPWAARLVFGGYGLLLLVLIYLFVRTFT